MTERKDFFLKYLQNHEYLGGQKSLHKEGKGSDIKEIYDSATNSTEQCSSLIGKGDFNHKKPKGKIDLFELVEYEVRHIKKRKSIFLEIYEEINEIIKESEMAYFCQTINNKKLECSEGKGDFNEKSQNYEDKIDLEYSESKYIMFPETFTNECENMQTKHCSIKDNAGIINIDIKICDEFKNIETTAESDSEEFDFHGWTEKELKCTTFDCFSKFGLMQNELKKCAEVISLPSEVMSVSSEVTSDSSDVISIRSEFLSVSNSDSTRPPWDSHFDEYDSEISDPFEDFRFDFECAEIFILELFEGFDKRLNFGE